MSKERNIVDADEDRDLISDLPRDVLGLIISKINYTLLKDINILRAVSKQWRCLATLCHPKDHIGLGSSQWLVKKNLYESRIKLYHPLAWKNPSANAFDDAPTGYAPEMMSGCISIDAPEMMIGASIVCSESGWLLMRKGIYEVFFFCPFSKSVIQLPDLPQYSTARSSFTFNSDPTSKDCQVIGVASRRGPNFNIFIICHGEKDWKKVKCTFNYPGHDFHAKPCDTSPVYHDGKFYCLFACGVLGVIDPSDPDNISWKVLKPHSLIEFYSESYLLKFDGDLATVLTASNAGEIFIYKWDELNMMWHEIDDIGEYMFFVSETSSFARKCTKESGYMKNKIYFPNFYDVYGVFYSLQDHMFKTFGNDIESKDLSECSRFIGCCWMEPAYHDHSSGINFEWFETSVETGQTDVEEDDDGNVEIHYDDFVQEADYDIDDRDYIICYEDTYQKGKIEI